MFEENYEKLSRSEQRQFQECVNYILYHCFVVRRIYDRNTKNFMINPYYNFISTHFDVINDYLDYAGIEIVKDNDNGVIYTNSVLEVNRIRLDGVTTIMVYALRSYFEKTLTNEPTMTQVYIDSINLKNYLNETSLSTASRRISSETIKASLRTLVNYNVLCLANGSLSEGSYGLYILPSIRYVISDAKLNALCRFYNDLNGEEENEEY